MGSFIYVSWANKCQENLLKILPLPIQEPIVFTMSCWLRGEESLVVWLLEVNLSKCRKLKCLFLPNEWEVVMLVSQHPNLGNLGSWEQTLQKGSPVLFLWVAPLRWPTQIMNSHHLPWLPALCDPWSSSELLGSSLYFSPRLIPPSCWPLISRSELGEMG